MKDYGNPMHPTQRLFLSPRCTAQAKRTGTACKAPAVRGWSVCRPERVNDFETIGF